MTELPLSHLPVPLILGPRTLVHLQRQWEAGMRTRESARAAELKLAAAAPRSAEPRVEAPHRTVDKQLLAEARLLLLLARGGRSPSQPKGVKYRCGACAGCMRHECGECGNCRDKKRFGGPGCRKRACSRRQCLRAFDALDALDALDQPA
jgi:hypothetical protein